MEMLYSVRRQRTKRKEKLVGSLSCLFLYYEGGGMVVAISTPRLQICTSTIQNQHLTVTCETLRSDCLLFQMNQSQLYLWSCIAQASFH